MDVSYNKKFLKSFSTLSRKQQEKIVETIEIFRENPFDSRLKNHALHGELQRYRAISAGGDLRLFFIEEDRYRRVKFTAVGTHSQLY